MKQSRISIALLILSGVLLFTGCSSKHITNLTQNQTSNNSQNGAAISLSGSSQFITSGGSGNEVDDAGAGTAAAQNGSDQPNADSKIPASQTAGTAVTLNVNGKQLTPRNPVKQLNGEWLVSTDDLDQIFHTYIDASRQANVEVNLASIVILDFDLQKSMVTVNGGTSHSVSAGAYREGKVVYLPIQTIAGLCGVSVEFDAARNQLKIDSASLRFQLPLTGDHSLQTVIMPCGDFTGAVQIQGQQGQLLLSTNQPGPIVGLQYYNVGAQSPLVLLIAQGGSGGQIYTAYLYNAAAQQFQEVSWGSSQTVSVLGGVGFTEATQMINLSQRTYDAVRHAVTTVYKWTAASDSPVGQLEPVSSSYGPVISSTNLPADPEILLEAALSSVAEHLPQETPLYFSNSADGTAFYQEWEPVFPFGDTVSVDLSKWSVQSAAGGSAQTVVVTTVADNGVKTQYSCTVSFLKQGSKERIQSCELTPITH